MVAGHRYTGCKGRQSEINHYIHFKLPFGVGVGIGIGIDLIDATDHRFLVKDPSSAAIWL